MKRIREGEGREALDTYRSSGRVIVAADPEARREEMVNDWWQGFGQGEDALMVAKRNVEVEKLNALAREPMRAEGRLGEAEIEVGEARFAAGDQVITRVNDHKANIYNRERWRVESVDLESGALVLDGIDTRGRVCVDSVFLGRVTNYGDPALQHAYAATTYQAQGATVDRAYVMADPSMNPIQAFYRRAIHRDELAYNPSALIDLPEGGSKRPKRIASAAEAAELLGVLPVEDRPVWATAFYAGLRRGELQALRVCDIDFGANLVSVERGWDQVEGVIEPKSRAGRRTVPLLAVLHSYLWDFLPQTGRSGEDLLFGRTEDDAFFASTVDGRAKRAWKLRNKCERGLRRRRAEKESC
ncbi:MAG TPA: hypothetical protein VIH47_05635 [Solirubrobacterales bacterium]